jgi:hypothetical protein
MSSWICSVDNVSIPEANALSLNSRRRRPKSDSFVGPAPFCPFVPAGLVAHIGILLSLPAHYNNAGRQRVGIGCRAQIPECERSCAIPARTSFSVFRHGCMLPLALVVLVALTPVYDTLTSNALPRIAFQTIGACVGVAGAIAGIVIFLGMLAYLLLLHRSSWKLPWLVVFLFTGWFGSSIYFFVVYRTQVLAVPAADKRE